MSRPKLLESGDPRLRWIYSEMNRQHVSLKDTAAKAGVHYNTLRNWRHYQNPTISDFIAVINALGYDLEIVRLK